MVLTVGEQHQNLEVVARLLVGGKRGFDRFGQRRAALRNDADLERLKALAKGLFVERERTLKECRSGEGHQGQPVAFGQFHEVQRGQAGAAQAVGAHVFGQHAARSVDGDDDVQSALPGFLPVKAPLWPRQRQERANDTEDHQREPYFLPQRRHANRQLCQQPGLHELGDESLFPAPGPAQKPHQQRHGHEQQPKHFPVGESHLRVVGRGWVVGRKNGPQPSNNPPPTTNHQRFTAICAILCDSR